MKKKENHLKCLTRLNYAVKVTEYSVNFSRLKNTVKCNEITEIIKSLKIQ